MDKRKAFTLLELLVVVGILALLLAILMPSLSIGHERAKRTVCASNMRGISQAMYLYAQDAPFLFPTLFATREQNDGAMYLFYPQHRTWVPSTTGIPSPTVDLWVLLRRSMTAPKQFICPSTTDVPDPATDTTAYYDFYLSPASTSLSPHLSYGYQYQHDPNCRPLGIGSDPIFPVLADANPYIKGQVLIGGATIASDRVSQYRGNSANHPNREGQNVLFVDAHVSFENGPDVGLSGQHSPSVTFSRGRDHCYTVHTPPSGTTQYPVDYGAAAPTWTSPSLPGVCNLGSKSDACLVP